VANAVKVVGEKLLKTDSQVVELQGRHRLVEELLGAGVEVALPLRDRGIDLIAYLDMGAGRQTFAAWPIQVKASTTRSFSIDRKYSKFPGILHVFVWGLNGRNPPEMYLLSHAEAIVVGDLMGWTRTGSWINGGKYSTSRPGKKLLDILAPYKVVVNGWRAALLERAT